MLNYNDLEFALKQQLQLNNKKCIWFTYKLQM